MGESRQAWTKVGEHFSSLGDNLKGHGSRAASEAAKAKPDNAAFAEALRAMGQAVDKAAASVSQAVKDPAVRRDAKNALGAMGDALTTTLSEASDSVGDKVKGSFGSGKGPRPGPSAASARDDAPSGG